MTTPPDQTAPARNAALERRDACHKHARDLITAARRVLGDDAAFPNVAYHLAILALEEIGKAGLIIARAMADGSKDTSWITKRLDDHTLKLMWAVWSPAMLDGRIDPKKFGVRPAIPT